MVQIHVTRRAKERYGLDLSINDVNAMAGRIRAGRSVLLRKCDGHSGSRHLVEHGATVLIAIFSHEHNRIVTVLPRDYACDRHPNRKQKDKGMGKKNYKRNPRETRYIPEIDLGEDAV